MRHEVQVVYGVAVGAAGLALLATAGPPREFPYLVLLAVALVVVDRFHLRLPADLTYSLATPLVVGGVVLSGMAGGLWLAVLDSAFRAVAKRERRFVRLVFNVGQAAVCAGLASYVYRLTGPLVQSYVAGAFAVVAFLVCNFVLIAGMVYSQPETSVRVSFARTAVSAVEMQLLEVVAGSLLVGQLHSGNATGIILTVVVLIMFSLAVRRLSEARYQSRSDPLTKLWNLRGFADDFQDALDRFTQAKRSFGIVVLDLDQFKEINDTYGHDVGNEVLRIIAGRLNNHVRQVDGVYRIGGEEFAVIMPDIRREALHQRAEELEAALRDEPVHIEGLPPLTLSASVGAALCPEDGVDYESLFRHADQAMYAVKQMRQSRRGAAARHTSSTAGPEAFFQHQQAR